jgi:hypothetical protein
MKIHLVFVGKTRELYLREGIEDFLGRLRSTGKTDEFGRAGTLVAKIGAVWLPETMLCCGRGSGIFQRTAGSGPNPARSFQNDLHPRNEQANSPRTALQGLHDHTRGKVPQIACLYGLDCFYLRYQLFDDALYTLLKGHL